MRTLAVGDGEGRNGVWLAEQGLAATSVDWSAVGLAKAAALASRRGVALRTVTANLTHWDWPAESFDAIAWIFVHLPPEDRALACAGAMRALAPGAVSSNCSKEPSRWMKGRGTRGWPRACAPCCGSRGIGPPHGIALC